MDLSRDDWELTENELKGQRTAILIQLEMNSAMLRACGDALRKFPKKKV